MTGPRVFEFAKEVGLETLALMNKLRDWSIPVKNHMAELDEQTIVLIRQKFEEETSKTKEAKKKVARKKVADAAKDEAPAKTAKPKAAAKSAPKKATSKKATEEASTPTKTASKTSSIIRRKASEMAESREAMDAEPEAPEVVVQTIPHEIAVPQSVPEITEVETQPTEETPVIPAVAAPIPDGPKRPPGKREVVMAPEESRGRNIIGRMDLSRAVGPQGARPGPRSPGGFTPRTGGPGGGGQAGGYAPRSPGGFAPRTPGTGGGFTPRTPGGPAGPRNIRTGFIPAGGPPSFPTDEERRRPFDAKHIKKTGPGESGAEGVSSVEEEAPAFIASEFRKREMIFQPKKKKEFLNREAKKTEITKPKASKRIVRVHDKIQVSEFAKQMGVKSGALMTTLMKSGVTATLNDLIDFDTAVLIAPEFGFEAENIKKSVSELVQAGAFGDIEAERIHRPPIVTVMGHVDHGKTSLLDAIRKANVAKGEAGGITQHIGAYNVKLEDGHSVTFLDTPGHAAFTQMRARGANVTDIAVIVVAADDGLMPQTAEAINHAKAANVPIIVAINKMDKQGVNPDRIKQQLTEFELVPEEWGGTTIYCPVSALQKTGIKELLEQIILLAEVSEYKANPKRSGTGVVIEAKMEKGRGIVATLLVKDGTVKQGQSIVAGKTFGRIKAMINDQGKPVKEAAPSTPVEILGLNEVPSAGDLFDICETDQAAEEVANARRTEMEKKSTQPNSKMSLEDLFSKVQTGDVKELPIVLKADVAGSAEAIVGMLNKEISKDVKVKIVHTGIGGINESDVLLANTAKGIVIGFNVRPDSGALNLSKREGIEIKTYSIIYELMDDIKKALEGLLTPDVVEKVLGHAEVRNTFTVPKAGTIAGCHVQDGKIVRSANIRLLREGRIVYDGKIGSLKRFKDDAKEVAAGFECGIGIENYNDLKVGDTLEVYEKETIAKTL